MTFLELRNPVQRYDWGSRTAIAELQGREPAAVPEAELWMGAHPKAPSSVLWEGRWTPLDEAIRDAPDYFLGGAVRGAYGARLPFLLKILAAARPLSIQAHPDVAQAVEGFARETAAGVALSDPTRNYRDRHHKPEVLYALTEFAILRGFRPLDDSARLLARLGIELPTDSWESLLAAFLAIDNGDSRLAALTDVSPDDPDPALRWSRRLADAFPGDRGGLAPCLLQVLELAPGEAVYTGPGVLHAYLGGVGVELMASSDNVLRGACTSKHVDPEELLRIVRFEPTADGRVDPQTVDGEQRFETPADEFLLSRAWATPDRPHVRPRGPASGVEILLVTEGAGTVRNADSTAARDIRRGDAFLVPGAAGGYRVDGDVGWFRAEVARCPSLRG